MPIIVAILGLVIIGMSVAFFMIDPKSNQSETNIEVNRPEAVEVEEEAVVAPVNQVAPETTSGLDDSSVETVSAKVYSGSGTYVTPARTEHKVAVSLTLADGVVTDASVSYDDGDGYSNANQERFDKAYKTEVIGKSLSEISLSRVGGASLTSDAFNQAVKEIQAQQS